MDTRVLFLLTPKHSLVNSKTQISLNMLTMRHRSEHRSAEKTWLKARKNLPRTGKIGKLIFAIEVKGIERSHFLLSSLEMLPNPNSETLVGARM